TKSPGVSRNRRASDTKVLCVRMQVVRPAARACCGRRMMNVRLPNTRMDEQLTTRADALLEGKKRLLEMGASERPLPDVLEAMCGLVEAIVGTSTCSVLLVAPGGETFCHSAGPTLPPNYADAIKGAPIVSEAGPCGMAASLKQQVFVPDLDAEPRWIGRGWR